MGFYYGHAILPVDVDVSVDDAVEQAVEQLIKPYAPIGDEHPVDGVRFDFCNCVEKEWYAQWGDWKKDFPTALDSSKLIIVPTKLINDDDVVGAVITPDGRWFQSQDTWRNEDNEWGARFLDICRPYPEHFSAVLFFRC